MKRKNVLLSIAVLVLGLTLVSCGQQTQAPTPAPETKTEQPATEEQKPAEQSTTQSEQSADTNSEGEELELTLEELAKFNGKDGNPAYIAVDGVIYDVTDAKPWANGDHNGYEAGADLTDAIKNKSPHGLSKLDNVEAIGKLVK